MYPHVGACGARKITPGVTELSRARVHGFGRAQCRDEQIDLVACFLDVGSSYPGSAHSVRQGKTRWTGAELPRVGLFAH